MKKRKRAIRKTKRAPAETPLQRAVRRLEALVVTKAAFVPEQEPSRPGIFVLTQREFSLPEKLLLGKALSDKVVADGEEKPILDFRHVPSPLLAPDGKRKKRSR